jgi:subtilisin family serine protease
MKKAAVSGVFLSGVAAAFLFLTSEVLSIDKQVPGPEYKPGEIVVKFKQGASETLEKQLSKGKAIGTLKVSASLDELSRRYKAKKIEPLIKGFKAERQQISILLKKDEASLTKREQHLLRRLNRAPKGAKVPELDRIYRIELEEGQSAEQAAAEYKRNPDVEYAELNYIVYATTTPDDPYYSVQWALNNTGQPYPVSGGGSRSGTSDADIDAPEAWDIYIGSSETIVAVIDCGVDYTHRDLIGNLWTDTNGKFGFDLVNNDDDPMDDAGHGTHCAGIIASRGNNGVDTAGVCWNAKIMAVKFLNASGHGSDDDAISSIHYAVDNGADVLSNSWGSAAYSASLEEAINYAYSQGVIVVAAAGNEDSDLPFYPASYEHVISVAATDSNDEKASFSSYGEWVDIAAPGVDILSLRAYNTDLYLGSVGYNPGDRFVPFGDPEATMYISSGTSMACPQAAGACALMLSVNPLLTSEETENILVETVDPIADGICRSDGRLNLAGALAGAILSASKGFIALDKESYSCDSNAGIFLADCDLAGEGSHSISITTTGGDSETVILTELSPPIGAFKGTIHITSGEPNIGDGKLQVINGDIITATYYDADDGTGNPATATDTSTIDCVPPVISDVQMDVEGDKVIVTFASNELTTGEVFCDLTCGGESNSIGDGYLSFQHTIEVPLWAPYATHYVTVAATDVVGNQAVDSNSGNCYSFTTTGPRTVHVPGEYATIQEAVNHSWPGSVVLVADGIYTGQGNRDIDFQGKTVSVKSENGPSNCIIDCQSSSTDRHCGFYFHNGETLEAIVDGLTIKNGYGYYGRVWGDWMTTTGGICCIEASPTITNCIITNNQGTGGIGCYKRYAACQPHINSCIISENQSHGVECICSNPEINNCVFTNNKSYGALYCSESSPIVRNCLFYDNFSGWGITGGGGAVFCIGFYGPEGTTGWPSNPSFFNCTFTGNSAKFNGGGIFLYRNSHVTATDCIFWGNSAPTGHEIYLGPVYPYCSMTVHYCDIQSSGGGVYIAPHCTWNYGSGNINADPRFIEGPKGGYYLSQIAAGQAVNSPCVNTGSNTAANLGMDIFTTRTDQVSDAGIADMGYHYPTILNPDLNGDAFINFFDYAILAADWLQSSDPCGFRNSDINKDGRTNIYDLAQLTAAWLDCLVSCASSPEPAANETNVGRHAILRWSPGEYCTSHDVYFGTDYNEVCTADASNANVFMGNQDVNYWDSDNYYSNGLDFGVTYYWRIDEIAVSCSVKGVVWKFTVNPGKAENPNPSNGQPNIATNTVLNWAPGEDAFSHDVYLGTDFNDVNNANTDSPEYKGNRDINSIVIDNLQLLTTYYWRVDERNSCGTSKGDIWKFTTYADPELRGWWKFDEGEGDVAHDSAGNNDGNVLDATWTAGKIDGALNFDGDYDYVFLANSSSIELPLPVTISVWIKLNVAGTDQTLLCIDNQDEGSEYFGIMFMVQSDNTLLINYGCGGIGASGRRTKYGTTALEAGKWYHVAAVLKGPTDMNLYVDAADDAGTYSGTGETLTYSSGMSVIGCRSDLYNCFNGIIDDVRVYGRALSAEEIEQLYQEGL